ncbi:cytosine permease [Marinomonas mediterranea]|uniref:Permease for cytosine/purines uracil thiamine allantoin n=1 Tax=Marinomonas mediterranea (strain ATCC 700492 / JCM 21426 / NBRC 103028 / MMB-1) TaxID=717774 RepID=F2JVL2_MARM1|nr:cytosine permease [Marinomonas mediterranea]ADZ90556.1 permease for cytosine/purines uracil thiamine allantoin [Marinomonas mediterranea MMB-1]WCN08604.1 cytosine permease [Marinomonas mediterranea]WCN16732.1 cytosine permease [Marinomonas mediterranea MMB-1]
MSEATDYPLEEVPQSARKGMFSTCMVLMGFTFFTATMFAGGKIGTAFSVGEMLLAILIGNLLLGGYAAALGYIAYKSGLNAILMGRFCFGEKGSKLSDLLLGFTQVGWYAWGAATIAVVLVKTLSLAPALEVPLTIFFGFAFCITAMIGYKGMDYLSRIAVPAMLIFILISLYKGFLDTTEIQGVFSSESDGSLSFTTAITIIIGTFVSGGTQATNWSRFAKSGKVAIYATLAAFVLGNGLMVLTGALGSLMYQQADIVDVMIAQGSISLAILMLFMNLWTTQDNTIYNFAVAGCNLLRTDKRKLVTLAGAAIGTILALGGMYNYLIPYLILLGTFIPPLGGVIMADFWIKHKGHYSKLTEANLPSFNWIGLAAYFLACACAFFTPILPPVVGVLSAAIFYTLLTKFEKQPQPEVKAQA